MGFNPSIHPRRNAFRPFHPKSRVFPQPLEPRQNPRSAPHLQPNPSDTPAVPGSTRILGRWLVLVRRREKRSKLFAERVTLLGLAFPYDHYAPAKGLKGLLVPEVASHIGLPLLRPEYRPGRWLDHSEAALMAMPETTMHEDYRLVSGQGYVRFAGKVFAVQPEAVAHRVQERPDTNFRFGVLAAYRSHVATSLFRCVNVDHQVSPAEIAFPVRCL